MSLCKKCWESAYRHTLTNPSKTQAGHYLELIKEHDAARVQLERAVVEAKERLAGVINGDTIAVMWYLEQILEAANTLLAFEAEHGEE